MQDNAGYTIGQTVLLVCFFAMFIVFMIGLVGWNLFNRAMTARLLSQCEQLGSAIGQFYATYQTWPTQSYVGLSAQNLNAVALTGSMPASNPYTSQILIAGSRNFLVGYTMGRQADGTPVLQHGFGKGGNILLAEINTPFGNLPGRQLVLELQNIPYSEFVSAREVSKNALPKLDQQASKPNRLVAVTEGSCLSSRALYNLPTDDTKPDALVNVCYAAAQLY